MPGGDRLQSYPQVGETLVHQVVGQGAVLQVVVGMGLQGEWGNWEQEGAGHPEHNQAV